MTHWKDQGYRTVTRTRSEGVHEFVSFDVTDAKGRTIGCVATRFEGDTVTDTTERSHSLAKAEEADGHYFYACVEATRNGVRYGASQPDTRFKTAEERDAFITKRVEASRKAANKKAGA